MTDSVATGEEVRSRDTQAWARWLGRSLDSVFMLPLVFVVFILIGVGEEMGRIPPQVTMWLDEPLPAAALTIGITFGLVLLWEPLFLSNTGATPGKWVMGVRVHRANGEPLGLFTALWRLVWVWTVGLGFGIPLLSLIMALFARARLIAEGATAWDESLNVHVSHRERHPIVWVLVIVFVFGVQIGLRLFERFASEV